jgi:hypothetical protein
MRTAFNEHGEKALWFLARRFGRASWDMLHGRELDCLWLELIAFFGLLFCVTIVCWRLCAFDQSVRYRCGLGGKAMQREE